ncbi:transposase [Streptomyces sp. NPDC048441]|uniref:transposase n=1 Tax=Streptomyces sp. NPDC048441 TaxID=3365552 RepID=UPI0037122241
MLQHRRGHQLLEWVRQVEHDAPAPILSFAQGLCLDLDAVTAGLSLPWSSGIVEGHVNCIKTIKRAMYGRATFRLLRTRLLRTRLLRTRLLRTRLLRTRILLRA